MELLSAIGDGVMSEKIRTYNEFLDLFVDMAKSKNLNSIDSIELGKTMAKIGLRLFVAAPDKVVTAYSKWRTLAIANKNANDTVRAFLELLLEMRRDIIGETVHDVETGLDFLM